jgi:hypothetical protein
VRGTGELGDSNLAPAADLDDVVAEIRRALAEIRHGSVTLIVQDGRVIQIDATRKVRFGGRSPVARRAGRAE